MSLATTGGGGLGGAGAAGGGLTLAHDAGGGAMAHMPQAPPTVNAGANATGQQSTGTITLPAIDICDKTQKLTLSQVKSVAHLPLTAVDLHAAMPMVALYPPKSPDGSSDAEMKFLGKMKGQITLLANETSHKTLRKFLTQAKPYSALQQDCLTTAAAAKKDQEVVILDRPHLWLGLRRVSQMPAALQSQFTVEDEPATGAIAEEKTPHVGCWYTNSTLLGQAPDSDVPDHDVDRVAAKVRLHASKKALTLLPEEGTQLLLHQARSHVAAQYTSKSQASVKDEMTRFPMSLALPAWAFHDSYMEALYEAVEGVAGEDAASENGGTAACLFLRSLSALTGALIRQPSGPNANALLQRLGTVQQALYKRHHAEQSEDDFDAAMTVLCIGTTPEGCEVTAIQVSHPQNTVDHVPFEQVQLLANVSKLLSESQHDSDDNTDSKTKKKSASLLASCLTELNQVLELVAPEVDGPSAILTYGTNLEQDALAVALTAYQKSNVEAKWLAKVPVVTAPVEAVATGAALLGGIAMGRHSSGKSLPMKIQTVATVATGVAFLYHKDKTKKSPPPPVVKTIFDFDRRLPAGPYSMEFKASECVVHAQRLAQGLSRSSYQDDDDDFLKAVKEAESAKSIPDRERAALDFTVQIYQKWTRHGEWQPVGNKIAPLVKLDTQIDRDTDQDKEETKVACEQVSLELSMAVTGILATSWVGERESVVQAMKSARGRLYEYYGWLTFAVLFFGGFFAKSYWEDYVWKRDTQRLLDYYAHIIPGSIQDGDRDTASWLAYKYRHNKEKLWNNLETKYGHPVPDEWPEDWVDETKKPEEPEEVDLDGETTEDAAAGSAGTDNPEEPDAETEEEPDL